ncbi:hypothetical protein [Streptomyces sp. MA5143a]|uniref:hypothetical protein n=1 Tax=Streptomyces sp. MA5143a TaxID=2083010 RepID=UPI000D2B1B9C|nr:hypothetical protein [Streptomyces sp. MA5143a]SPF03130.1 hypothetical protein SMA5143A_3896 [Streptomyces sp. MA5143a]
MSSRTSPIALPAEQLTTMPVDTLARLLLRDMAASEPLYLTLWVKKIRRPHRRDRAVMGAVSEAVAWLRHHMYLVEDLGADAEGDWVMISRRGRQWLREPVSDRTGS